MLRKLDIIKKTEFYTGVTEHQRIAKETQQIKIWKIDVVGHIAPTSSLFCPAIS